MSVILYDVAVLNKIKGVYSNTVFQNRDLTFHTLTDIQGRVTFPYISIYRPDGWSVSDDNSWIETYAYMSGIRQVLIDLSYQIDIYANTREDLEAITAELILYLIRNPSVDVTYTSADGSESVDVSTYLIYVSGPERTSELEDDTVGRPYRYTLVFELSGAYLYAFANYTDSSDEDYVATVSSFEVDVDSFGGGLSLGSGIDESGRSNKLVYKNMEQGASTTSQEGVTVYEDVEETKD